MTQGGARNAPLTACHVDNRYFVKDADRGTGAARWYRCPAAPAARVAAGRATRPASSAARPAREQARPAPAAARAAKTAAAAARSRWARLVRSPAVGRPEVFPAPGAGPRGRPARGGAGGGRGRRPRPGGAPARRPTRSPLLMPVREREAAPHRRPGAWRPRVVAGPPRRRPAASHGDAGSGGGAQTTAEGLTASTT